MVLPFYLFTFLPFYFFIFLFFYFFFLPSTLSAQTFTQRIQQKGSATATIVIHQPDSIDQLVNNAKLGPTSTGTTSTQSTPSAQTTNNDAQRSAVTTTDSDDSEADEGAEHSSTKKMMKGYKVNGYRVQAFAGGNSRKDRQEAERIGNEIKAQFNNVPVYVHFYSPRWICRVGNFRTYEEAHQMLIGLRKMGFSQATIVKGKITVPY